MKADRLIDLCRGKTVWIQTHNFPDQDAIASAFGLQKFLEVFGIFANICYTGQIDKMSTIKLTRQCRIKLWSYDEILPKNQSEGDETPVIKESDMIRRLQLH